MTLVDKLMTYAAADINPATHTRYSAAGLQAPFQCSGGDFRGTWRESTRGNGTSWLFATERC